MGIEPVGSPPPPNAAPAAPSVPVTGSANFAAQQQQLLAEELQPAKGGGGGHGGGHGGAKKPLSPLEEIAARSSLAIERRKTPQERAAEIERLKRLAEQRGERVHEREDEEPA